MTEDLKASDERPGALPDLGALASYVRFYLTVVTQLRAAWESVARVHASVQEALAPFADSLAPARAPALLAALAPAPKAPDALAALWKPADAEGLGGLTDVYEVVGRFTFQGDDNQNLALVQGVVAATRNELYDQRARLRDLGVLPDLAGATAARLSEGDARGASQRRAEKAAAFGPLAQTLAVRAKQTGDAVRAVALPDLTDVATAAEEYGKYAARVDQVYQTCLPFLRKALGALYAFAGCEVPASWPDTLPLVRELPAELLAVPPADSAELSEARRMLKGLDEEEAQLRRTRDDLLTLLARLEGELGALALHANEAAQDLATAGRVVELARLLEQVEAQRAHVLGYEQQRAQRVSAIGETWGRHQKTQTTISALEQELAGRAEELTRREEALAEERKHEPVLFGKDEFRLKVAALEQDLEGRRAGHAQRLGVLNQLRIDLSSLSVQVQTEQAQSKLVERWTADAKTKEDALRAAARELEGRLGNAKPARALASKDAEAAVATLEAQRLEAGARVERLRGEQRRQMEDGARLAARFKQIEAERQRATATVESAQVAATQGRDAAVRTLSAQRKEAVLRHAADVLGALEKSLASIEAVFVEPARQAMLKAEDPSGSVAAMVREAAGKVGPVVEALSRELDPELLAQDAMLGQVQREFCDVAAEACRAAWSAGRKRPG